MLTRTDRRRFPILLAVIAALAMAMLFSPVQAQEGSVPDQPMGLEATATHDSVTLTWDDPGDDTITGYVILRRIPAVDPQGQFSELVSDTGTDATTYTDDTVAAETRYTYRIKAINGAGTSERSRWSHIDVPAAPGGPGKRANVSEGNTDCPNDVSTTCEVDVGGSVTGNLSSRTDFDWFRVDLEADTRYQIDLEGEDTGRGTLPDPVLLLYDGAGSFETDNETSGVGDNAREIYTPTATGTYYVGTGEVDGETGTYTLSVIVLGANGASEQDTDFPETTSTTGRVEVGASATGNISTATDKDWFKVVLEADKTYQIDMKGVDGGGGTLVDPWLDNIRDSSGDEFLDTGHDDIGGEDDILDSRIIFTPTEAGTYYLVATLAATPTGTYTLSVSEVTPAALPTLSIVNKSATEGDLMTFPLSLSEATSENVTVTCTATFESGDTAVAEDLTFTSANGRVRSGQMVGICAFRSVQDTTDEEDETFTVTLSGVSSNAQLATDPTAKGTILDNDDSEGSTVLVSNIGQAHDFGTSMDDTVYLGQGFTVATGGGNYTLTSIEIPIVDYDIAAADINSLSVSVWSTDSSGFPSASLHSLTNPSSIAADTTATFNAQAGATLEAGKTYAVIVYYDKTLTSNYPRLSLIESLTESGVTGWTIANERLFRFGSTGIWSTLSDEVVRMRVNGTAAGGETPSVSTDATLSALSLGTGVTLSPTFDADTYAYTASVANSVDEVTVTPTTTDTDATFEYLDSSDAELDDADTNAAGHQVALDVGDTVFKVKVTAEDGTTTQNYTVTVTRAACALNEGDIWCGVVTVGDITNDRHGFLGTTGGLSDETFSLMFETGTTNNYTILAIQVASELLYFVTDSGLTDTEVESLALHVDGESDPFVWSDSTAVIPRSYRWPARTGLDWSSETTVTLRLREFPRPRVTNVAVTSTPVLETDTYGAGERIEVSVTFSEAVDATSDTDFVLSVGGARRAPLVSGSGTATLVFGYAVVSSDEDTNGIWIGDETRTLVGNRNGEPQNGTITSVATGAAAVIAHTLLGTDSDHKVDGSRTTDNVAPAFTSSATFDAAENQTAAGTVLATDDDTDDSVTGYEITGGADQTFFSIGATSGVLTFDAAPNYEDAEDQGTNNTYVVDVTATSGTGTREMTATQTITVTVTDVAEQSAKPDKPTLAAVSGSTTSLTATWTKPDLNGGPDITGYDLQYRAGATGTWSSSTSYGATVTTATITGLTADTSYQARVLAKNGETDSDWSDASDAVSTNAAVAMMPLDVLVSNYPEGSGSDFNLTFEQSGNSQRRYFAQTFTAGAGFTLTAVDIPFRRVPDNSRVTVSLHARNGSNPGTYLGELDLSGALAVGDNTFAAPAGTALAAGEYFIRLRWRMGDTDNLRMTDGPDDETSAESGWSIEDRSQYSASGSSWSNWNQQFAMRVRGTIDGVPRVATGGVRIESDPDAHDSYGVGEEIEVAVGFTDDVTVDTTSGTPRVALTVGSNTRYADYSASDSSADELAFVYEVTADDHDQNGVSIDADALELNGGAIHKDGDTSTNAVLDHAALDADSDHRVNRDPIIVSDGVSVISDPQAATDTYGLGEVIEIEVEFSAAVDATTNTDFVLSVAGAKRAPLLRGSGTKKLVFGYTVVASDDDDDGIWIGEQDRTLVGNRNGEPQNGEITSAVTDRAADLDHDSPGVLSDHKVDGSRTTDNVAPSFTSLATFDAAENQTAAGTVVAADSDSDDSVTGYAITGGADQALFEIGATSGELTFKSAPNFEDPQDTDTGNDYVVDVTATSGTGTREMTATQTITVTVTDVDTEAPGKPGAPTVSAASATSLSVSWSAPSNAGPAITDYDVQYRAGTSGDWSDGGHVGTATTATLTGLSEDTSYQVQVRATNAEGTGDWSDSGSGTTDAAAPDDCPHDTTTTCEVDVGGSATGTLDAGDRDWFKVELEADTRYQIDVEGVDTGRGTVADPTATVLDPMGGDLVVNSLSVGDTDSGVGKNARVIYAPTAGGTYFVQVRDLTTSTGTYTLSVIVLGANGNSEADTDFPNNNTTTGKVEVGASATGNVESAADRDWFAVDLEAGKRYQFDLEGAPNGRGTQPDPFLLLYDRSATAIEGNDDLTPTNLNSAIVYDVTATGTYYLVARGARVDQTGTYTLSVRDITPAVLPTLSIADAAGDEDDGVEFTATLTAGVSGKVTATWTASIESDDTAVAADLATTKTGEVEFEENARSAKFTVPVNDDTIDENNETFTVTLSGVSSNAQLAADPTAKGTILDDDDPPVDDSGTEEDDLPADTTTTGTVEVGEAAVRGDIFAPEFSEGDGPNEVDGWDFDTDWFEVELEADKTYRIDMWGHTTANGLTLRLPQINAIYDSKGSFIVNTWYSDESDSHYLFRVTFTASSNRSYYIAASGESFEWGTYKLWVKDITEDDHGDHGDEGDGTNGGKGLKNLRAVEEKGGVRLTWQSPDGAAVTGYRIERRRAGGQGSGPQRSHGQPRDHHTLVEDTGNTETSYVDESAEQGVEYEYQVSAHNESGPGEESDWVRAGPEEEPVLGDALPGAPRNLTATPGNREVTLSWDPPDDNGNPPATRYRIEWRVDGKDYDRNDWGTSQETTYTTNAQANLANGVKYFFRVKAENDDGNSYGPYGPSSEEVSSTPTSGSAVDLGTPVLSDTETLHHGMVQLDWQDIEDAGWYVVQYYHVEDEEWLDLPAEGVDIAFHGSSAVVSNLHGLSWLRVGAASCDGASEWSQIEELYGTNASDWEGVPVPDVEEGDEIEPCPVVLGTPVLSDTEILHHGMVQLDWQDIEDAGWYVVQYYHLEDGEWLDLPAEGVDIAFHGSSAVVSNLHGLSWLRVGAASCDGASEWSQIEESYGTNASDWKGVPVPEVAEGDEIEPCSEDADTSDNSPATGAPTISGTAHVGETLTADTSGISDADGRTNATFSYQWLADDADISGATNATYTLADTDEGKAIKVQVGFTDDTGNGETLTSAATDAVAAAPTPNTPATGAPTISGTAQVGETLTADTSGIADADGLSSVQYEYQWLADDADISGATNATYTLTDSEESKAITVQVSFTDDADNEETLTSAATDVVAGAQPTEPPDKPTGLDATATHDSVTLTWDDPGDDSITGYVILRRIPGVDPEGHFDVLVADTGTAATTYTDDTVSAETRYTYRIKAINGAGTSERSRWSHIDTPAAPVPDKPTGLEATESDGQVVLTWDDPGDDSITGYVILRRDSRERYRRATSSVLVADTGTDATTYTDDTVSAETRYTYRIKAINGAGTSERSRWSHIDTPAAP